MLFTSTPYPLHLPELTISVQPCGWKRKLRWAGRSCAGSSGFQSSLGTAKITHTKLHYLCTSHSSALCDALRRKYGDSNSKNLRMCLFKVLLVFLSATDLSKDRDVRSNKLLWNSSNLGFCLINSSRPLTPAYNQVKNSHIVIWASGMNVSEKHTAPTLKMVATYSEMLLTRIHHVLLHKIMLWILTAVKILYRVIQKLNKQSISNKSLLIPLSAWFCNQIYTTISYKI